mgnify:CR=1 FL=1
MKESDNIYHFFYTQNKISYLIIRKIILDLNLHLDKCVILQKSEVSKDSAVKHIDVRKFMIKNRALFWKNWPILKRKKIELSKELDLENIKFVFYNSSFTFWYNTFLINHPNCIQHNFLEEGASAYCSKEIRDSMNRARFLKINFILRKFLITLNHKLTHTHDPFNNLERIHKTEVVYALIKDAYQHKNVKVISDIFTPTKLNQDFDLILAPSRLSNKGSGFISVDDLLEVFDEVLDLFLKRGYTNIAVKFHPEENSHIKLYFEDIIKSNTGLKIEILENNISIENVALAQKPIIVTDTSAIALYCAPLGSKVYTYRELLKTKSAKYREIAPEIPEKLDDKLISLKELPNKIQQ